MNPAPDCTRQLSEEVEDYRPGCIAAAIGLADPVGGPLANLGEILTAPLQRPPLETTPAAVARVARALSKGCSMTGTTSPTLQHEAASGAQRRTEPTNEAGKGTTSSYLRALESIESCARCAGLCPSFFLCAAEFGQERVHG